MTSFMVKYGQIWSNLVEPGQTWSEKDGQKNMVKKRASSIATSYEINCCRLHFFQGY
jgi:hypothetical protein